MSMTPTSAVDSSHPEVPKCPFDHQSPEFAADLHGSWDEARDVAPLVWTEAHGGYWVASGHAITRKLAIDSDAFTVSRAPGRIGGIMIPPPPGADTRPRFVPGEADGEEHDHYRLALNPHFSKARVKELEPKIQAAVQDALDNVKAMGNFDIAYDLVAPILAGVTCEIMGIEVDDPRRFFDAQFHIVSHGTEDDGMNAEFEWAWSHIVRTVDERRAEPRNDVVTALTQWDPPFTDDQIHMMIMNVSLGANDTTKSLMAQALIYVDQNPELREQLAANHDQIKPAIDEFLRLIPVATGPGRTATRDVEVDGMVIREGEMVLLGFSGANHDPEKYPNPRVFDLERGSAQHLGMGVGTHFCLGAWLAKSIMETTLRELLVQCPNFSVDHDNVKLGENRSALTATPAAPAHVGELP